MNIVIDTNTFISGIFWHGNPLKVLQGWKNRKFEVIVNRNIIEEYVRIINEISKNKDEKLAEDWISYILENAKIVQGNLDIKICRDSDDNKFIECAILGDGKYIVSGDNDLLVLKEFAGVKIVKAIEFLKILEI